MLLLGDNKMNKYLVITLAIIVVLGGLILLKVPSSISGSVVRGTLEIGASLPLSGPNAVYGKELYQAIELAREEINLKGGINGKKLLIIYEDDAANPAKGTEVMQKLATVNKVPVVLGSWASGVVLAEAPIAEENKVVVMASAISPKITEAGDYIFRMQPSAITYTKESAKSLARLGVDKVAIIYARTEFAESLKDSFKEEFKGSIVAEESYDSSDKDVKTQLLRIRSKDPQLIFIAGYQDTVQVIKQIKELGIKSRIMAGPPFESKATLDALGSLAEGVIYPYHYVSGTSPDYESRYLAKWGEPTGGFAPLMYDGTKIIAEALSACDVDTACIKNYLYSENHNGILGNISFYENGDPTVSVVMKTVKDGKFVELN